MGTMTKIFLNVNAYKLVVFNFKNTVCEANDTLYTKFICKFSFLVSPVKQAPNQTRRGRHDQNKHGLCYCTFDFIELVMDVVDHNKNSRNQLQTYRE